MLLESEKFSQGKETVKCSWKPKDNIICLLLVGTIINNAELCRQLYQHKGKTMALTSVMRSNNVCCCFYQHFIVIFDAHDLRSSTKIIIKI
jgi:hypothetical protein